MRKAPVLIVVLLASLTAGCVVSGKPGKPVAATPAAPNPLAAAPAAPPPQSLSIPQTQVELPKPQPVDPAAFAPEPTPPAEPPADTSTSTRTSPGGRGGGTTRPGPQQRVDSAAPPAVTPAEPQPTIQEIIPQAELKRYQEQAHGRWKEVQQVLNQLARRRLTPAQANVVTNIRSFLASSMAAEKKGDMKFADALAERALILAKDLLNGK